MGVEEREAKEGDLVIGLGDPCRCPERHKFPYGIKLNMRRKIVDGIDFYECPFCDNSILFSLSEVLPYDDSNTSPPTV